MRARTEFGGDRVEDEDWRRLIPAMAGTRAFKHKFGVNCSMAYLDSLLCGGRPKCSLRL